MIFTYIYKSLKIITTMKYFGFFRDLKFRDHFKFGKPLHYLLVLTFSHGVGVMAFEWNVSRENFAFLNAR